MVSLGVVTALRVQWAQWLIIAASFFFCRDCMWKSLGAPRKQDAEFDELMDRSLYGNAFVIFALLGAAAQLDSAAAQRKVLQYAMSCYLVLPMVQYYHHGFDYWSVYVFSLLNLIFCVLVVYAWNAEEKWNAEDAWGEGKTVTALRINYFVLGASLLVNIVPGTEKPVKLPEGFFAHHDSYARWLAIVVVFTQGMIFIAAAQVISRKILQYGLLQFPVQIWIASALQPFVQVDHLVKLHAAILAHFFITVCLCYPAHRFTHAFRFFFITSFYGTYICVCERNIVQQLTPPAYEKYVQHVDGDVFGAHKFLFAMVMVAGAQLSEGDQEIMLQYLGGGLILSALGSALGVSSLAGAAIIGVVLYWDKIAKCCPKLGSFKRQVGDGEKKHSSKAMRSATPAMKKKHHKSA